MPVLRDIVTRLRFRVVGTPPQQSARGVQTLARHTRTATARTRELGNAWAGVGVAILQRAGQIGRQALGFLTTDFARTTDEAAKTSRAIGITIGSFQRLSFAAQINGATQAQLTTGMRTLAKRIRDASLGLKTAKDAFRDVGVTSADLASQKPDQIFLKIADRFRGMTDPVKRAALAQELFGRGGLALVNTLSAGSSEIDRLGKRADRLGITMDAKTGAKAESFTDRMLELKSAIRGVRNILAGELLPKLTALIQRFVKWITTGKNMQRVVNGVKAAAKTMGALLGAIVSGKVIGLLGKVGRMIAGIGVAFSGLLKATGIGLLIVLLVKAWQKSAELRAAVMQIVGAVGSLARVLAPVVTQIVQAFMPLVPVIAQVLSILAQIVTEIVKALGPTLADLIRLVADVLKELIPIIAGIMKFFLRIWRTVIKGVIIPLIKGIVKAFRAIIRVVKPIINAIAEFFKSLWSTAKPIIDRIGGAFKFALAPVKLIFKGILFIFNQIKNAVAAVIGLASKAANAAKNALVKKGGAGLILGGIDVSTLAKQAGLAGGTRAPGSRTSNVSVGNVSVNVQGSTGMNPAQISEAVRNGTRSAVGDVARETMRDFRATE